jgi:hypothetical protein
VAVPPCWASTASFNWRLPDVDPIPQAARIRIERLLDRLELTLRQIKEVEAARDAILKKPAPADEAERMIRSLVDMRAIGNAALLPRGLGIAEPSGHGAHGPQQGPAK